MEEIELLFETWIQNREIAEDCTCDLDMGCFWHLTEQQQMEERVSSLAKILSSFCDECGLRVTIEVKEHEL